jgi:hypothetical protein
LDAHKAKERRQELERWEGQWGLPPGRGAPFWWGVRVQEERGRESRSQAPSQEEGQDVKIEQVELEVALEKSDGADTEVCVCRRVQPECAEADVVQHLVVDAEHSSSEV